ncbi:NYN domain-containing protein [Patescibacteria group bacterium]|nr:NYN domain-containing protein [Patescibacteria group bacterium]
MMRGLIKGKVAVFIDAANLELSAKDRGWRVDYLKLYSWLKTEFDVYFVGFYTARFDTQEHDRFLTFLKKTGYELSIPSL